MKTENNKEILDKLALLLEALKEKPQPNNDYGARIAELEVKIAKLWALIVTQTPAGQDKVKREIKPLLQQLKEASR